MTEAFTDYRCGGLAGHVFSVPWGDEPPRSTVVCPVCGATSFIEMSHAQVTILISDMTVERARLAGKRWFAEHPNGASADDEWRDHYRAVLEASLFGPGEPPEASSRGHSDG